jgi:hypothetical protein
MNVTPQRSAAGVTTGIFVAPARRRSIILTTTER